MIKLLLNILLFLVAIVSIGSCKSLDSSLLTEDLAPGAFDRPWEETVVNPAYINRFGFHALPSLADLMFVKEEIEELDKKFKEFRGEQNLMSFKGKKLPPEAEEIIFDYMSYRYLQLLCEECQVMRDVKEKFSDIILQSIGISREEFEREISVPEFIAEMKSIEHEKLNMVEVTNEVLKAVVLSGTLLNSDVTEELNEKYTGNGLKEYAILKSNYSEFYQQALPGLSPLVLPSPAEVKEFAAVTNAYFLLYVRVDSASQWFSDFEALAEDIGNRQWRQIFWVAALQKVFEDFSESMSYFDSWDEKYAVGNDETQIPSEEALAEYEKRTFAYDHRSVLIQELAARVGLSQTNKAAVLDWFLWSLEEGVSEAQEILVGEFSADPEATVSFSNNIICDATLYFGEDMAEMDKIATSMGITAHLRRELRDEEVKKLSEADRKKYDAFKVLQRENFETIESLANVYKGLRKYKPNILDCNKGHNVPQILYATMKKGRMSKFHYEYLLSLLDLSVFGIGELEYKDEKAVLKDSSQAEESDSQKSNVAMLNPSWEMLGLDPLPQNCLETFVYETLKEHYKESIVYGSPRKSNAIEIFGSSDFSKTTGLAICTVKIYSRFCIEDNKVELCSYAMKMQDTPSSVYYFILNPQLVEKEYKFEVKVEEDPDFLRIPMPNVDVGL